MIRSNFWRPTNLGRRARARRLACLVLATALVACARPERDRPPLLVFAASDLRDALTEIAAAHRAAGGDSAVLVFGSTGDLATQIANGAPADLFFAANAEAIDMLAARAGIVDSTRQLYAVGRLAVIARCTRADTGRTSAEALGRGVGSEAPGSSSRTSTGETPACPSIELTDLAADRVRTVAIADPSHAPYGRAAQQALERAGLWESVGPKLVLGANISQAELFVTTGNADAGIVAVSLLHRGTRRPYTPVESSLHDPLLQTVAVVARSPRPNAARTLIAYLQSPAGRSVMERYGFAPPPARVPAPRDS